MNKYEYLMGLGGVYMCIEFGCILDLLDFNGLVVDFDELCYFVD